MNLYKMACRAMLLLSLGALCACGTKVPTKEAVAGSIKNLIPVDFEVVSVTPLKEIPGLVQVVVTVGKQPVVFYTDSKVKYVISGSVMEVETKKNLTAERISSFAGGQKGNAAPAVAPVPKVK
jgi:hypothetical protein